MLSRVFVVSAAALALLFSSAEGSSAHGGPPLRLGVWADPTVSAAARLVLVHLREGVGFAVDWREFPDETALRSAFAAGKIDVAVGLPEADAFPVQSPATAECPRESLDALSARFRMGWGGEAYLLGFSVGRLNCLRPALIVARAVLEDLRFGILAKESARLASFVTGDDVTAVRAAAERGGERAATAAARAALAAKTKR